MSKLKTRCSGKTITQSGSFHNPKQYMTSSALFKHGHCADPDTASGRQCTHFLFFLRRFPIPVLPLLSLCCSLTHNSLRSSCLANGNEICISAGFWSFFSLLAPFLLPTHSQRHVHTHYCHLLVQFTEQRASAQLLVTELEWQTAELLWRAIMWPIPPTRPKGPMVRVTMSNFQHSCCVHGNFSSCEYLCYISSRVRS